MNSNKRILIIGAAGMLGNAMLRIFSESPGFEAIGTVRNGQSRKRLPLALQEYVVDGVDVESTDSLVAVLGKIKPHVVINCVGVVKQLAAADEALVAIPINSILPHRLASICELVGARLVHMSTDCVFSGSKGMYVESDFADAYDLYGRSKYLGEVDRPNAITLRTSIIGHELDGARSLLCWFLAQQGQVKGFRNAIFSGLPTVEIARLVRDFVIPHPELHGLYHVSAEPINKYDLLCLIRDQYAKQIDIIADDKLRIDRSLDSSRFRQATQFTPAPWPELIRSMHEFG